MLPSGVAIKGPGYEQQPLKHREMWDAEEKEHNKAEVLLWLLSSFGFLGKEAGPKARLIRLGHPRDV